MQPDFLTFQQFDDAVLAEDLTDLLTANNIPYEVEEAPITVNPLTAINTEVKTSYSIKISPDDFNRVSQLLKERESQFVDEVDKDYYLFTFTDDELMEILEKPDEWSSFDYVLAKKILEERGITVDQQKLTKLKNERIEELSIPEKSQSSWIIIGYICAFLGGVLGIFIGWHLSSAKKTLPDGEQIYSYTSGDRKHGRIIFYLSLVGTAVSVFLRFQREFSLIN